MTGCTQNAKCHIICSPVCRTTIDLDWRILVHTLDSTDFKFWHETRVGRFIEEILKCYYVPTYFILWVLYSENSYQPSHYGIIRSLPGLSLVGLPCIEGTLKAGQAEKKRLPGFLLDLGKRCSKNHGNSGSYR